MSFDLHDFVGLRDRDSRTVPTAMSIISPTSGRCMGSSQDDFDVIEGGYNAVVTNPYLIRCVCVHH